MIHLSEAKSWAAATIVCIAFWVMLATIPKTSFYFPSPVAVVSMIYNQSDVLLRHITVTAASSVVGFAYGAIGAIVSTLIAILLPRTRGGFSLFATVLYSVPLIAAAPLAALLFGTNNSGAVLGCIGAYLPIFLSGLRAGDRMSMTFSDLVRGYGATDWDVIRYIRLPLVLRGWIVGAQSGWLWAVLGALLGDFTGGRWGLGTFLVSSLARGDPNRVWAIVVLCLALSAIGLVVIRIFGKLFRLHGSADPLDIALPTLSDGSSVWSRKALINSVYLIIMFLLAWQLVAWILNIDGGVFTGPLDLAILTFEIINGQAEFSYNYILSAFSSTWFWSLTGVALSLTIAFAIATGQHLMPLVSRPVLVLMLITQVTPIVAFVPLIAFYFGRGPLSVIAIVIFSTIYPSYIVFHRALEEAPQRALDVVSVFGGSATFQFIKVRLQHAAWMTDVALRLAIGRALLGAITAEYLLTGTGVGGILGQTRALLDFRIVWLVCVLVATLTLITNLITMVFKKTGHYILTDQGNLRIE